VAAITNLGICYQSGQGVIQDITKAHQCFEQSAKKGNAQANFFLGEYYMQQGNQSKRHEDYAQAAAYFRQAIQFDPSQSQAYYDLAFMFQNGFGVDRDQKTAQFYYKYPLPP
jgi:hypothetical protein